MWALDARRYRLCCSTAILEKNACGTDMWTSSCLTSEWRCVGVGHHVFITVRLTSPRIPSVRTVPYRTIQAFQTYWLILKKKIRKKNMIYYWKTTGTPSLYKNVPVKKLHILKNDKYVSRSYYKTSNEMLESGYPVLDAMMTSSSTQYTTLKLSIWICLTFSHLHKHCEI